MDRFFWGNQFIPGPELAAGSSVQMNAKNLGSKWMECPLGLMYTRSRKGVRNIRLEPPERQIEWFWISILMEESALSLQISPYVVLRKTFYGNLILTEISLKLQSSMFSFCSTSISPSSYKTAWPWLQFNAAKKVSETFSNDTFSPGTTRNFDDTVSVRHFFWP